MASTNIKLWHQTRAKISGSDENVVASNICQQRRGSWGLWTSCVVFPRAAHSECWSINKRSRVTSGNEWPACPATPRSTNQQYYSCCDAGRLTGFVQTVITWFKLKSFVFVFSLGVYRETLEPVGGAVSCFCQESRKRQATEMSDKSSVEPLKEPRSNCWTVRLEPKTCTTPKTVRVSWQISN